MKIDLTLFVRSTGLCRSISILFAGFFVMEYTKMTYLENIWLKS